MFLSIPSDPELFLMPLPTGMKNTCAGPTVADNVRKATLSCFHNYTTSGCKGSLLTSVRKPTVFFQDPPGFCRARTAEWRRYKVGISFLVLFVSLVAQILASVKHALYLQGVRACFWATTFVAFPFLFSSYSKFS